MKSTPKYLPSTEPDFAAACREIGKEHRKLRWWTHEICLLLGIDPDTLETQIRRTREELGSPCPYGIRLYMWKPTGRLFCNRSDIIRAFHEVR